MEYEANDMEAHYALYLSVQDAKTRSKLAGSFEEAEDRLEEGPFSDDKEDFKGKKIVKGSVVLAKFEAFPAWPTVVEPAHDKYPRGERGKWRIGDKFHWRMREISLCSLLSAMS